MNQPIDDKLLDDYLQGDSPFSRRYREMQADEDVPPALDATILAAAAKSAAADKLHRWRRWSAPLAIAATVVLAIAVVIRSGGDKAPLMKRPTATVKSDTQEAASVTAPAAPVIVGAIESNDLSEARRSEANRSDGPALRQPREYDAESMAADASSKKSALEEEAATQRQRRTETPPPPQAAAGLMKDERAQFASNTAAGVNAPQSVPVQQATATSEPQRSEAKVADSTSGSRDEREASNAAPPPAAPRADKQKPAAELEMVVVTGMKRPQAQTGAGPHGTVVPVTKEITEREWREGDPRQWLSYIRVLRIEKKTDAADREWQRFVKAYPDFKVAQDDTARPKAEKK